MLDLEENQYSLYLLLYWYNRTNTDCGAVPAAETFVRLLYWTWRQTNWVAFQVHRLY